MKWRYESVLALVVCLWSAQAMGQQAAAGAFIPPASVLVNGRGEVSARPDRAVVRIGAFAQAEKASFAQEQVNKVMADAIEKLKALGIAEAQIQTVGLTLMPVYAEPTPEAAEELRVRGYRASNVLQIRLDDLARIGPVIDTSIAAGANQLEGVWFELKDDAPQRREALRRAVGEARLKADAIAAAVGTAIDGILEIQEGGVDVVRPMMAERSMVAPDGTPVQVGEVQVEAHVSIRYRLAGGHAGVVAPGPVKP